MHKAVYSETSPEYLNVTKRISSRNLRNCKGTILENDITPYTFKDISAKLFNDLPTDIREELSFNVYSRKIIYKTPPLHIIFV